MKKGTLSCHIKHILTGLGLMILVLSINGCGSNKKGPDKPMISVSILPQKYFLEKISGNQFYIQVMIPPGESPATYDPTPEQMISLSKSTAYFLIGDLQFEKSWILDTRQQYPSIEFINTSKGLQLEHTDHDGHDHQHSGVDPHTWMTPANVKVIAATMAGSLAKIYPEKEKAYQQNLFLFNNELDSLHRFIEQELQGLRSNEFIIYHPALTYYARDYHLIQVPIENEGKEPSAKYMKTLIDRARAGNIRAILVQQQFNQEEARTIEKQIGGKIIVIDPLAEQWKDQMIYITNELKSVLK